MSKDNWGSIFEDKSKGKPNGLRLEWSLFEDSEQKNPDQPSTIFYKDDKNPIKPGSFLVKDPFLDLKIRKENFERVGGVQFPNEGLYFGSNPPAMPWANGINPPYMESSLIGRVYNQFKKIAKNPKAIASALLIGFSIGALVYSSGCLSQNPSSQFEYTPESDDKLPEIRELDQIINSDQYGPMLKKEAIINRAFGLTDMPTEGYEPPAEETPEPTVAPETPEPVKVEEIDINGDGIPDIFDYSGPGYGTPIDDECFIINGGSEQCPSHGAEAHFTYYKGSREINIEDDSYKVVSDGIWIHPEGYISKNLLISNDEDSYSEIDISYCRCAKHLNVCYHGSDDPDGNAFLDFNKYSGRELTKFGRFYEQILKNGLPDISEKEARAEYDEICRIVEYLVKELDIFGNDSYWESHMNALEENQIYLF